MLTRMPIMRHFWRLLLLWLCLLGAKGLLVAQCALICNQGLQVSLDNSGQALIVPSMIAPSAGTTCPGALTVSLFNNVGQAMPNPLDCSHIGQTVTARVQHTATGNFCTGTLHLVDALPPVLSQCSDQFVFCHEDPSPSAIGLPQVTDNCTPSAQINLQHFDAETNLGCGTFQNGLPVLKRIDRQWFAQDQFGNSSSCQQKIWVRHIALTDVTFPPNRDNITSPALSCEQDPSDLDLTGQPTVNGKPIGATPACETAISFTEQTIQHCAPAGFTLLRNWTAIDFCSGNFTNRLQIVRVEDKVAPVLDMPDDLTIGTDGYYCTGSLTLPQASASDNCSSVSISAQWSFGSGFGTYSSVPLGEHFVTYRATDACGNTSTALLKVTVEDSTPPQAVCTSDLQVSLTSNGEGVIHAAMVNVGSFDNCGPVFLSISRDEETYFPFITVNCSDIGQPIPVTLRVLDAVGLENLCQMEVQVRDFLKPALQCPPNLTLNCLQDPTNLALTGQAQATDNCQLASLDFQDISSIQACNIGNLIRRWTAVDAAGNTRNCDQNIALTAVNGASVSFPTNITLTNCAGPDALLPTATGEPLISGQFCSPLSVNYTDQVFTGAPPSCFRIFRHWLVIDHCLYNPNGGGTGVWEHTQIIDIQDNTPPTIQLPDDVTVNADSLQCMATVLLPDAAAFDCSSQVSLSHDSPYASIGGSQNASGSYPLGEHVVVFTATDACGNSATNSMRISVRDVTPPKAACLTGLSFNLPASGVLTLDPNALDGGCSDFCSPQNSLLLSVLPASLGCSQSGLQTLTLQVQDPAGNTASCQTQALVKDPTNACGGLIGHQIDGSVRTPTGTAIHNIPVVISGDGFVAETACDTFGRFSFDDVPTGNSYFLQPQNDENWLNGVTTYDLVLISKHILGLESFDSPYKTIAADANRSGSVTTFDIVQLRQLILGINDYVPNNKSWRFVAADYSFPNPLNPFAATIKESIVFDPLADDVQGADFVGIKVGDVNGSANPAQARHLADTLTIRMPNVAFEAGESISVPVFFGDWAGLEGLQMEWAIERDMLVLEKVTFAHPQFLGEQHTAILPNGRLSFSWDNVGAMTQQLGDHVFSLHFRAKVKGELSDAIALRDNRIAAEAYRNGEATALRLFFDKKGESKAKEALSLFPNPTSGAFWVKNPFNGEHTRCRLLNSLGQCVWEKNGELPEMLEISGQILPQAGQYWVEMSSGEHIARAQVQVLR
jgi:hypothetical protein